MIEGAARSERRHARPAGRVRGAIRVEDVLLAAWLILVDPLLAPVEPGLSALRTPWGGIARG